MRKTVICMLALFLCVIFSGCKTQELGNDVANVILFVDEGEKTKEVTREISNRIEAAPVDIKKLEDEDLDQLIEQADLILVGAEGESADFFQKMGEIFSKESMDDRRVSLFYIGEEEKLEKWKKEIRSCNKDITLLPCFLISWKEEVRIDELSRMNGWLTSAFTY